MKQIFLLLFTIIGSASFAQVLDTLVEPRQTSFENFDLLAIALIGLAILLAVYFLWRRRRKK